MTSWCPALAGLLACLTLAPPALAADRFALIVTGASGGEAYAAKYDGWRQNLENLLTGPLGYPSDQVFVLADTAAPVSRRATRDNVRAALAAISRRATRDDVVLVLLIGHGTAEGEDDARFNLVGPDLTAREWAALVKPVAGRLVFVNGASGSFPFLKTLAAPNRLVITANDSAQQQFETVFPGFFIGAFGPNGADLDRNGKVSMLEAFAYASAGVRDYYESRGQLPTERPLLDDTGDGIGREAEPADGAVRGGAPVVDGKLAQATHLQPDAVVPANADPAVAALMRERAAVEQRIEALRTSKPAIAPADYEQQLEALLLELARLDRLLRAPR